VLNNHLSASLEIIEPKKETTTYGFGNPGPCTKMLETGTKSGWVKLKTSV
jgi:hypothetical protein